MKKLFKLAAIAAAAVSLSSCTLASIVKDYVKVAEEAAEIASGKVFLVEKGTVTYDDGSILTFKDNGKNWASILVDGDYKSGIVVKDEVMYQINYSEKTYYKMDAEGGTVCPFIFWETLYEFGNDFEEAAISKGSQTIAGKDCKLFEVDGETLGGWKRILFLSNEFKAVKWEDKCDESLFKIDGFKEIQIEE